MVRELRATFREEAYELLSELESALLELEKDPADNQQIGRAFRAMHTIKGSGGACEFHEVSAFTHELESIFDKVRSGKMTASKEIITLTLTAKDQIEAMFNSYYRGGTVDPDRTGEILASFRKLLPGSAAAPAKPGFSSQPKASAKKEEPGRTMTYRIRFRPVPGIFSQGTNPVNLLNELRELGKCNVVAQTEAIPYLEDFDPQACHTYWDVILSTSRGLNAIQDVFIFVKDSAEVKIDVIAEGGYLEDEKAYKKLGEILLERGDLSPQDLKKVLNGKKRVGEMLVETGIVPPSKVESALVEQQHVREMREQRQGHVDQGSSSIRVATSRLDSLVNLVGELVTVQARLSQTALNTGMPALVNIAEEVERLTASLRDNAMSIRMLPIGTTFSKFRRVVRDLSAELGKEIELVAEGAETELDKTVIERLSDPLVHIIRNSVDHGIELPEVRMAAGKPKRGTITLSALHSGAHVLIRVQDDGAGLDAAAIRAKAIEKGLIQPEAELGESELMELILAPGFSTARNVTGVSGRGVGMDVVKRAIDALRGTIEISSVPGRGTSIMLKLPLTLAIIDGFLTRICGEHFIFPLSLVQECIELSREEALKASNRRLANVRGQIVPYIRLREYFLVSGDSPAFEQIVIVNVDGRRVGLVVDTVVGEHQTVLKSLGKYYHGVEGISGATILGDGTVALILDIPKLVRMVEQQEAQMTRGGEPS
ncbi:MAG: chemotaxis protein CheA [Nitrospirae bacterium GWD2_57_9]|nr:MAG: chemotaxis protein CheA [Nitrospirae bacterium GWD2_57_9]OGW49106.1 MAG: chemotaxis protein CheA [Nitrospirae bacterium GWC2_57_9]